MGSVTKTRGRLPRRVYWVRRSLVLATALLMVFGIGRLVGATGSDDPDRPVRATTSSAKQPASSAPAPVVGPVAPRALNRKQKASPPALAAPSGACRDDEITVLPSVPKAAAGGNITLQLRLLGTQPACTFQVAPESLVVKITSGEDRIWSSQECPKSIPATTVVVRSGTPVDVPLVWSGRRSDEDCSTHTSWALPGFYHVFAAALGSTPTDVQFEVTLPDRPVVTRTAKPKPSPTASPAAAPRKKP